MQYTLRNIPKSLDRLLRQRAKSDGKSLNAIALEALSRGLGVGDQAIQHTDLDWFLGKGSLEDAVLNAIKEQDVIHPDDWK